MLSLILAAALEFRPQDAHLAFTKARELVEECTPRDAGTNPARSAAFCILDAASAAGGNVRRDTFRAMTPRGEREFTNLYAEFKFGDESARWVVVVSHYDTKPGSNCPGANDGASTTGLLIGLVNALTDWQTPKGNLLLIWTDGEESMSAYGPNDGLWGSRRAVEYLASKSRQVQAVICLDMLGDKDLEISIPELVQDDHVPFLEKGYKAIDLIDFSYGPNSSYWHTPQDTMDKISEESLLKSGRLVAEMLNILL